MLGISSNSRCEPWQHVGIVNLYNIIWADSQVLARLSNPLLAVSMLQIAKRNVADGNLMAEALSSLVDTFRLTANAVGANNLQESPSASKHLQ